MVDKSALAKRIWGRMNEASLPARIVSLVFVMTAIVAMSFCQDGLLNPLG